MRRKPLSPYFFSHSNYSRLLLILLPLLIAVTLVSAAVFGYYPVSITANWVIPPVRFQAVPGVTTVLSDDDTAAVVDVTLTGRDLVHVGRSAFIYDDFVTNPFPERLTTNTNVWKWQQGWRHIRATVDGRAGSWGGEHVAYYAANATPQGTRVVYMLCKEWHDTAQEGQFIDMLMIESSDAFYTMGYNREFLTYPQGIHIGKYSPWTWLSYSALTLSDNQWFIFLGRRVVSGSGSGTMSFTVYDEMGVRQGNPIGATDASFSASYFGVGIQDVSPRFDLTVRFDEFLACADAYPWYINVTQLQPGWRAYLESENARDITSATADSNGVASLNVLFAPSGQIPHDSAWIVRDGYLRVEDNTGVVIIRKRFSLILGGDTYALVSVTPTALPILGLRNFDSKPYDVSLRIESLDVRGYVNSMDLWISSGSGTSTPIRISNNGIVTYETSTLTLGANSLGYVYLNTVVRPLSAVTLVLTFRYSLTGVEVKYLNSITIRVYG
jgi:hypothetical protein